MTFRILFCALLATAMGQSVVITTLPSMGRVAGLSEFQVAILMSSSALVFALGTTVWSKVAKKLDFRRTLMIGLTGYSIGTLCFATVWQAGFNGLIGGFGLFLILLITRTLQSSVMSATPPSAVGYAIAISSIQERVKAISKVTSANNLGQIIGPTFAGLLVTFGLTTPLFAIVALTLFALWLVWRFLPIPPPTNANPPPTKNAEHASKLKAHTSVLIFICASLFCAMAMMQQSLGFFFIDHYQHTPVSAAQQVGVAMMVTAVCSLAVQLLLVQRRRLTSAQMAKLALPMLAVGYLLLFYHQHMVTIYLAMSFIGVGMGMGYPSLAALATSICKPENQSMVTGMITATPAMGYIIGPPLSALCYQLGHRVPFLVAGILLGLCALIGLSLIRYQR